VGLHQPGDAREQSGIAQDRTKVYALVAFLYYRNGIIKETDCDGREEPAKVEMPNKNGFIPAKPVYPPDPKWPSWY
jgi:hypothetical protein